jgi:hypothetical protein
MTTLICILISVSAIGLGFYGLLRIKQSMTDNDCDIDLSYW